mgnify:CR=1 FL=1
MYSVMPTQAFGDPVPEGRAADIVRGVQRMMGELGFATLTEMTLASGRRADIVAISGKGEIVIVEVKSCLTDYATDQKWPEYAAFCDRFFFAVDTDFPHERLPECEGYIVADQFGGAIVRDANEDRLSAARRKALTLSFARLAAARLLRVVTGDPAAQVNGVPIESPED